MEPGLSTDLAQMNPDDLVDSGDRFEIPDLKEIWWTTRQMAAGLKAL